MKYEYTKFELEKGEFYNLVFMGAPSWWENIDEFPPCWDKEKQPYLPMPERQAVLNDLCYKSLRKVVDLVIKESGLEARNHTAAEIFDNIKIKARGENYPWFKPHAELAERFETSLMPRLWIRNLARHERQLAKQGSFYTDDGNHRALVYAMLVECNQKQYKPVKALHATSWDIASGILGHEPQKADNLEHNGKLQHDSHLYTVVHKGGYSLPGIRIDTYKRRNKS